MIIRSAKNRQNPYTMIRKDSIQDPRLSWKGKGLIAYFLSLPDDWEIKRAHIEKQAPDGRDGLSSGLKELEKLGYIVKVQDKDSSGKFAGYHMEVHECPLTEIPSTGKPYTENPQLLNTKRLLSTKSNNNPIVPLKRDDRFSKQFIKEKFEEVWKEYPKQESMGAAERAYSKILRQNKGLTPETIIVAVRRYAEEVRATGRKPEFIKCFSRWLADKCWLNGNCESPEEAAVREFKLKQHLEAQDKITAHGINLGRLSRLLIAELGEATYKAWFSPMFPVKIVDGCVYIQAKTHFMADWVAQHYSESLLKSLQQIDKTIRSVEIHVEKRIAA